MLADLGQAPPKQLLRQELVCRWFVQEVLSGETSKELGKPDREGEEAKQEWHPRQNASEDGLTWFHEELWVIKDISQLSRPEIRKLVFSTFPICTPQSWIQATPRVGGHINSQVLLALCAYRQPIPQETGDSLLKRNAMLPPADEHQSVEQGSPSGTAFLRCGQITCLGSVTS